VRIIPLILFCLSSQLILSQPSYSKKSPPNTVWLYDHIFIDETEISNIHWLEYLYHLRTDSSEINFQKALPDTSVWLSVSDTIRWKHYLRYPAYRYYPVVGISQIQAINYCAWRSAAVNQEKSYSLNATVTYRLPSEKEWILAASANLNLEEHSFGYEISTGKSSLKNKKAKEYYKKVKSLVDFNVFKKDLKAYNRSNDEIIFNVIKSFKEYFQYGDYAPSNSYDKRTPPNSLGLYQMIGNVAEMLLEEGVAKGGSWFHYPDESIVQHKIYYSKPEPWLGFRCVCEISPD